MSSLVAGLLIVIATHSLKLFAPAWRLRMIGSLGVWQWRLAHSALSLAGLALLIVGYGEARAQGDFLYFPPPYTRHLAVALMLPSLTLVIADLLPRNHLQAGLRHPALLGTMLWAVAHLIANGRLAECVLFGGFLLWALAAYGHARWQAQGDPAVVPLRGEWQRTLAVVVLALLLWACFIAGLHQWLIGVPPLVFSGN